ncbi:MAG: VanZ family protein [Candidatus Gottesmanbacteria bacterium]
MDKRLILLWLPVIIWCGIIFYLSSLQVKPPTGTWLDIVLPYIVHLGEYGILFTLTWRASKNLYGSIIFVIIYAFSDEIHQAFVPTRTPDLLDVTTDIIGMLFAWLLIWKFLPKTPKKLKNLAKSWQII